MLWDVGVWVVWVCGGFVVLYVFDCVGVVVVGVWCGVDDVGVFCLGLVVVDVEVCLGVVV